MTGVSVRVRDGEMVVEDGALIELVEAPGTTLPELVIRGTSGQVVARFAPGTFWDVGVIVD